MANVLFFPFRQSASVMRPAVHQHEE